MKKHDLTAEGGVPQPSAGSADRLHKLIARAGVASRRAAEELIQQGRVVVNGHVVKELGCKADPERDRIVVDGHPLKFRSGPATVLLLHKPRGYVTTKRDPEGRSTVVDLLPQKYQHLNPVGRLDYDTSGVLLLTDDGPLIQLLTHPSHGVEKVYWARVRGQVAVATLKRLEAGVLLEDGKTLPCRARLRAQTEQNALVEITLREGRTRQVRRMLEAVGHPVRALRRIRFGGLGLDGQLSGTFRLLLPGEVHHLRKAATANAPVRKSHRGEGKAAPAARVPAAVRPVAPSTTKAPAAHPSRAGHKKSGRIGTSDASARHGARAQPPLKQRAATAPRGRPPAAAWAAREKRDSGPPALPAGRPSAAARPAAACRPKANDTATSRAAPRPRVAQKAAPEGSVPRKTRRAAEPSAAAGLPHPLAGQIEQQWGKPPKGRR